MFHQKEDLKLKSINTVYVLHDCKYANCLKSFLSIPDLITHVEQDHLDFSPPKVDQLEREHLESIPMSYVLRFSEKSAPPPRYVHRNEHLSSLFRPSANNNPGLEAKESAKKREGSSNKKLTNMKDDFSEILSIIKHEPYTTDQKLKKPYGCNMPGCQKRFKNVNGIKYHYKNYHKVFQQAPAFKRSVLKSKVAKNAEVKTPKKNTSDWNIFSPDYTFNTLMDLFLKNEENNAGGETRYLVNASNICVPNNEYSIFDAVPVPSYNNFNMVIENQ